MEDRGVWPPPTEAFTWISVTVVMTGPSLEGVLQLSAVAKQSQ